MTDARNIAIEKNRAALLRIVRCWLMIAKLFGAGRILPYRIGLFVSDMVFKAETAAHYLQIASGQAHGAAMPVQRDGSIAIRAVINRLKTIKNTLIRLKPNTRGFAEGNIRFKHPNQNNCARDTAFYMHGGLPMRAVCRAPPCLRQFVQNPHTVNRTPEAR